MSKSYRFCGMTQLCNYVTLHNLLHLCSFITNFITFLYNKNFKLWSLDSSLWCLRKTLPLQWGVCLRHHVPRRVLEDVRAERRAWRGSQRPVLNFWLLWSLNDSLYRTMAASSNRIMLGPLVAAIDQGTSSTRFLVSWILRTVIVLWGSGSHTDKDWRVLSVPLPTCAGKYFGADSAGLLSC